VKSVSQTPISTANMEQFSAGNCFCWRTCTVGYCLKANRSTTSTSDITSESFTTQHIEHQNISLFHTSKDRTTTEYCNCKRKTLIQCWRRRRRRFTLLIFIAAH